MHKIVSMHIITYSYGFVNRLTGALWWSVPLFRGYFEITEEDRFRLVAGVSSWFLRLVRLLDTKNGQPFEAFYASDAVRSENHRARLGVPTVCTCGENTFS